MAKRVTSRRPAGTLRSSTTRRATAPKRSRSSAAEQRVDLVSLFSTAAQTLAANQTSLNQADAENHNHGDNMVQTFSMITQALAGQPDVSPSQQLSHASQYLTEHTNSGSSQAYAQGLAQAAQQLQGQPSVTPENALVLLQSLLGGGQAPSGAGLLDSLLGGQAASSQPSAGPLSDSPGVEDLMGTLLGGQGTHPVQSAGEQAQDGLDLGDLLNAGMSFLNARQQGQDNLQAALTALMSTGALGNKPHRQESGQLVANAMLQALGARANRKQ